MLKEAFVLRVGAAGAPVTGIGYRPIRPVSEEMASSEAQQGWYRGSFARPFRGRAFCLPGCGFRSGGRDQSEAMIQMGFCELTTNKIGR